MRNRILIFFSFFCSMIFFAQNKLAIINDQDGFTFIRSGQGKDFNIIDTLFNDEFFYFQFIDNSDWAKVTVWNSKQVNSFVHKSRIQEFEKLDFKKQKELIIKHLKKHRILADNFQSAWKSKDSVAYKKSVREIEFHSETKYDPILTIIPKYFCLTNDINIIQIFFTTMWADKGTANEKPSFSIGDCFICNPDLVIEQLCKIKNIEQRIFILDQIEWGISNQYKVNKNGETENKEYNRLKAKLDKVRIKSKS